MRMECSPEEEGQALAASGVLQAAGLAALPSPPDSNELRARLGALIAASPHASLTWCRPQGGNAALKTDVTLAAAWRDAFVEAGVQGPARLLIETDAATDVAEFVGLLRRLQAPLVARRGGYPDWRQLGAGVVGSVALLPARTNSQSFRRHRWSWPLRINLPALVFGYGVERGFMVRKLRQPFDVELAPVLPVTGPETGGVRLVLDSILDPVDALRARLLQGTIGRRPEALVPVDPAALPELLTALSYEVAHDAPIDFALSLAWLRHGIGDLPPVFLAPGWDWPLELESTRLHRRVTELVARLRLPTRRDSLYIDRPLRAFDLYNEIGLIGTLELADRLERALRDGAVRYDQESDVATDLLMLERALADRPAPSRSGDGGAGGINFDVVNIHAGADIRIYSSLSSSSIQIDAVGSAPIVAGLQIPSQAEAERYADLILYQGFHFGHATPQAALRVAEDEALRLQSPYTLEVAIRRNPIGIAAADTELPVEVPPDRTDPGVVVVISCRQANAPQFHDRLLTITWPHDADSTVALFRMQTGDGLPAEPLCLEIRLYARAGLQLLDLLELRFAQGRWAKHQPQIGRLSAPAAHQAEDAMSFHVARKPGGYDFEVVFTRDGKAYLDAPLGRLVSDADLELLLRRVRSFWTRLVIGKLGTRTHLSAHGHAEELGRIVELGGAAWRTLFGDRHGAQAGTPEALGEMLRLHPLPDGSPVRVTLANDADAFVFPWAILSPPLHRQGTPDPEVIWGLRHRIELTRKYCEPYGRPAAAGKVRIATVLDPGFASSVDHAATLRRVAASGVGAELIASLGTAVAVLDGLETRPPADIYYYFCHGFGPGRAPVLARDLLLELRSEVERLNEAADQRLWQALLDRLGEEGLVAAMFTGDARITEDDLRGAEFFSEGRPIVFLNMCHSADLQPSLRSGLTRVFIDRNAVAVLGTECPITSVFADMFAERVLGALLCGATIGAALLEARRHFQTERNPLGLLYTLYGHEDARVTEQPMRAKESS